MLPGNMLKYEKVGCQEELLPRMPEIQAILGNPEIPSRSRNLEDWPNSEKNEKIQKSPKSAKMRKLEKVASQEENILARPSIAGPFWDPGGSQNWHLQVVMGNLPAVAKVGEGRIFLLIFNSSLGGEGSNQVSDLRSDPCFSFPSSPLIFSFDFKDLNQRPKH